MRLNLISSSILFLILFSLPFISHSQTENFGYFSQTIPIEQYQGYDFKLEAKVRAEVIDDSASAKLFVGIVTPKGWGFFDNMAKRPVRSKEWKNYSVEGKIDSAAIEFIFGTLCKYNGKFFYDDFSITVRKNRKGKWQKIFSDSFNKEGIQDWKPGLTGSFGVNKEYQLKVVNQNGDNRYLVIEGTTIPNYGINTKAGKYAEVNGIKLYYEVYGEGHPLIVLHGNGGSIGSTTKHYPFFTKHYKVIAVDTRAHGNSTDTPDDLTYEQMASDVNELLTQLKIDSANIWGHSDGGILGLILAMEHPEKVKKVLAFGANLQPDSLALYSWAIKYETNAMLNDPDPKVRKLNKLMMQHPNIPFSELKKIKAPVLVMAGDRDIIREEHTLKIFQAIPKSQLCILPGTTHWAADEKPELFYSIAKDFFDKPFEKPDSKDWFEE